jgi:FkbM family methyltransferase
VLTTIKRSAQQLARGFGLDVRRHDLLASEHTRLALLLAANEVDLVLDIGANTGQWARELRRAGYAGDMISFEPLPQAHAQLKQNAIGDPNWVVAKRVALGERIAEVEINVAGNSLSSSLLPMLPMHVAGAPHSAYVSSEKTPMVTLDSLIGSVIPSSRKRIFCKLDVQGYEAKVLAGAARLLEQTIGIQMEISLAPLYKGQPLFKEMLESMGRSGFEIFGFIPGFVDPASGRMLQIDGVFFKTSGARETR